MLLDLQGRAFGKLTVLARAPNSRNRKARWQCRCECGRETVSHGTDLMSGHTTSCGKCVHLDDLTGKTFGKLIVLARAPSSNRRKVRWSCRCACGNEVIVGAGNLRSGNTKACGCEHFHDLTGQKFGLLTVLRRAPNRGRRTAWWCQCSCGSPAKSVWAEKLVAGNTVSCGCHRAVDIGNRRRTHGRTHTREYNIWQLMKRRCENPDAHAYENYGGRGISVAPEFETFQGFFDHLGPCPHGYSLDRIDNDGNYAPDNVRWADHTTQGRNKRNNRLISFRGRKQPLSAWAEELGLTRASLLDRLDTGWPLAEALTLPKGSRLPQGCRQDSHTNQSARRIMKIAIACGRLIRQPCAVCGNPKGEGHHTDYSRPLSVVWLCRKHHNEAKRK